MRNMNDDINLRTIHDTIYDIRNVLLIFSDKAFFFFFYFCKCTYQHVEIIECVEQQFMRVCSYSSLHIAFVTLNLLRGDDCEYYILRSLENFPKIFVLNKEYFSFSLYIYN